LRALNKSKKGVRGRGLRSCCKNVCMKLPQHICVCFNQRFFPLLGKLKRHHQQQANFEITDFIRQDKEITYVIPECVKKKPTIL
jgi:hypothetical protein